MIGVADAKRFIACACVACFASQTLIGQQVQFQGSVPAGVASSTPLVLTLHGAIERGLKNNLGLLLSRPNGKPRRRRVGVAL